jgi:cell division transport system permease protein
MSRLLFFIQEAFRALRRNAAPSTAAIVTTGVTVILLGVLIPIFQTASAKSEEVRGQLNFRVALYADGTQAEIDSLGKELKALPHVATVEFISKSKALVELKEDLG